MIKFAIASDSKFKLGAEEKYWTIELQLSFSSLPSQHLSVFDLVDLYFFFLQIMTNDLVFQFPHLHPTMMDRSLDSETQI